jgi:hypothetical protein
LIGHLQKLLSISDVALCNSEPNLPPSLRDLGGSVTHQLLELLQERNGFYAFERALHVLPSNCLNSAVSIGPEALQPQTGSVLLTKDNQDRLMGWPMDLERWNMDVLWRSEFGGAANGLLFFAEDAFGEQFALSNGKVWRFNPESAAREEVARHLDEWAEKILADYSFETGYQQAHDWQQQNGRLMEGQRLIPRVPFIMGGKYEADNLFALDAVKGMRYRADIWKQIRDLPDGSPIQLKILW